MTPRLCLCGCGRPVAVPRRKDGYRVSRKSIPVRRYASRACAAAIARASRARTLDAAQRARLAPSPDWVDACEPTPCAYCGEDVLTGRDIHPACAMRQARETRWTRKEAA